ncbi:Cation-transporting ATPase 13A1 [Paragonimus skrjabini miyazakii]|uniref:Cation-transporting ATPase 13A1 n=1 Tax=Paragonimus skrjabini miyazakii TaxID=59628 RepID=A0A8S9YFZ8_9TREM|nr:Cation-transporting ATPase 13A1 [Paragonimus skrjabini miyazakii]
MSLSPRENFPLTQDIASVELYNARSPFFHGYVLPFVLLYSVWLGVWFTSLGFVDYFELGLIVTAVIAVLQILICLFCHWFVDFRCLMKFSKAFRADQAQYAKVVPTPNNGSTAIVKIEHKKDPSIGTYKHFFFFQRLKYTFDNENKNSIYAVKFPIDWKVSDYLAWRGHDTIDKLSLAEENSGFNE